MPNWTGGTPRVQFREGETAGDFRAMWDTIERLWMQAAERAGRLPAAALTEQVNEEWSFAQTLRHLVCIADAWASRTVLDEEMPGHRVGLPQSWYPAADAAGLGIELAAEPGYGEILAGGIQVADLPPPPGQVRSARPSSTPTDKCCHDAASRDSSPAVSLPAARSASSGRNPEVVPVAVPRPSSDTDTAPPGWRVTAHRPPLPYSASSAA